jgi:AraC-like DNA-binding protein
MADQIIHKLTASPFSMIEKDEYIFKSLIVEGNNDAGLDYESIPRLMAIAGICICQQGEIEIVIDARSYHLKRGNMCMVFPNNILQTIWKSCDFKGYLFAVNRFYFDTITLSSTSNTYMYIKENPCIALKRDEYDDLYVICEELKKRDKRTEHGFRYEISIMLAKVIYYEVFAIYQRKQPLQHQPHSRKNNLFLEFQQLIATHYQTERTMDFYADKLCITTRYLSSIAKDITGLTASDCIEKVVVTNIQLLLTSTDMSIQQISEKMNFPNPSFFSKYFKRLTGMTPRECRERSQ